MVFQAGESLAEHAQRFLRAPTRSSLRFKIGDALPLARHNLFGFGDMPNSDPQLGFDIFHAYL